MKPYWYAAPVALFVFLVGIGRNNADNTFSFELDKTVNLEENVTKWNFQSDRILVQSGDKIVQLETGQVQTFEKGRLLNTFFSKDGRYYAAMELTDQDDSNTGTKVILITVSSIEDKEQYQIQMNQGFDEPYPMILVSDKDGSLVMGYNATGQLIFYSSEGARFAETELFPGSGYDLERTLYMDAAADGARIAVAAQERAAAPKGSPAPEPDGNPKVFLFNSSADLMWEKELEEYNTSVLSVSPDGNSIITNAYTIDIHGKLLKKARLFDRQGRLVETFDMLFKNARFSDNSKNLLMADNRRAISYNFETSMLIWEYEIANPAEMITAGRISNKGDVSALLVATNRFRDDGFVFEDPELIIYSQRDKSLQQIPLKKQLFTSPGLWMSPNASEIYVGLQDSYQIFRGNNEE